MGFNRDAYVEGGMRGVVEFIGRLEEIEEEVEGSYGPQDAYHYYDVEVTESEEEVELEEGRYTAWNKHSIKKNSVSGKTAYVWMDFAEAHGFEPPDDDDLTPVQQIAEAFKDRLVRYRRMTHEFGEGMNPGQSFVPVEDMEAEKKTTPARRTGRTNDAAKSTPARTPRAPAKPKGPAQEVVDAVMTAVGEDGSTRDLIRRAVVKKAALRTALGEAGGLDKVLEYLVENDKLTEADGFYAVPEDNDEGEVPF
jgi:hypothetical protein